MQNEKESRTVVLKPLLLCCLPEFGRKLNLDDLVLPSLFTKPEIALSYSAQEQGWLKALSGNFKVYCSEDCEKLILKLNSYDLLIADLLSLNTLAKFALGLRDSFPTELMWQFSALGKPILLSQEVLPDEKCLLNPHLIKVYHRYWQTVIGGNTASFTKESLDHIASRMIRAKAAISRQPLPGNRIFITRDDVIIASESLEPLRVPFNAVITEIAEEEALARGVIIIRE